MSFSGPPQRSYCAIGKSACYISLTQRGLLEGFQPNKITLIDDVITKGSTIFACAKHLHEQFPEADIRAFALIRTQGLKPEIDAIVDPTTGRIAYNAAFDEGDRQD